MNDLTILRRSLRQPLLAISGVPDICWENRSFEPPDPSSETPTTGIHLVESIMPVHEKLVATGQVEILGIYQINVRTPKGTGTEDAEAWAKKVRDAFEPGNSIASVDVSQAAIAVDRCEPGVGHIDQGWYVVPVSVTWRSYAPKA